jgi:hypothetical protein
LVITTQTRLITTKASTALPAHPISRTAKDLCEDRLVEEGAWASAA